MSLIEHAKQFAAGASEITDWLGSDGQVVSPEEAQERANICLECAKNVPHGVIKEALSGGARKILEFKNKVGLRVNGEKRLGKCQPCGCVLKLLVWQPQRRIEPFLTAEERPEYPSFCWKLKKP